MGERRVDIMFGRYPEEPAETTEYVVNLRNALEQANDYYDVRVFGEPYVAGNRVWLYVPAVKFATSCDGPYEVLAPLSDVTYRVRKEGPGGKIRVEHCNRLKPCKTPPNRIADQDHHPSIHPSIHPSTCTIQLSTKIP